MISEAIGYLDRFATKSPRARALPWVLLLLLAGCPSSSDVLIGEVSGRVMRDGQPAADVSITFFPDAGRPSYAVSDSEGNYTLKYTNTVQGAAVGSHTVTLMSGGGPPEDDEEEPSAGPSRPSRKSNQSAFEVTLPEKIAVSEGENVIELVVP